MSLRPFQLRPGEELRPGLIRIADRIAKKSAALSGFRAGKAESAIHEARLLVKLLRTVVWTARPALGPEAGQRIRAHLRAAAQCLADSREAGVLASTLSTFARKVSGPRHQADYTLTKEALVRNFPTPDDASVRRKLATASRHLGRASLLFQRDARRTSWPGAAKRCREAARSCRRPMKRALSSGRADDFHEWRKKAKRLLLLLRVIEIEPDRSMRKTLDLIDQLQSKLGDHHDLVVLEGRLRKNSLLPHGPGPARNVLGHLHRQRKALEKHLRPLGMRCRRASAKQFKI